MAKIMNNTLDIIVPIFNEEHFLKSHSAVLEHFKALSKREGVRVLFCLGGGNDRSEEILIEAFSQCESIKIIKEVVKRPSVHKSISLGTRSHLGQVDYYLVCPIDVFISLENFDLLFKFLIKERPAYGAFHKKYDDSSFIFKLQAFYLNYWRLGIFKEFVWTNAPFFKSEHLRDILGKEALPEFLDDLFVSRKLLTGEFRPLVVPLKIVVSSRRYLRRGILKQVFTNFLILIGHALGKDEASLKRLYKSFL
jgi:glycosyltransferase involved in cell wall biosynthesis